MSTRGTFGFRVNGTDCLSYNHSDSYPSSLGEDFVRNVRELVKLPDLKERVAALKIVSDDVPPTQEDIKKLRKWTDLDVGDQSENDWYCLLRGTQGSLKAILESGYIKHSGRFILDAFCEYAYILNLDEGVVEFYAGFQKKKHKKGRYGQLHNKKDYPKQEQFWGCALVGTYPMNDIPEDWNEQLFPTEDDE